MEGGNSASAPETPVPSQGRIVSATINSAKTNYAYPVTIYLPASYDIGNASYPTIYALDGDSSFLPPDTRFTHLKNILERLGTQAILIGVGGTERRQTDYNLPGAYAYHDFMTLELIPYVESHFRADVTKRMVSGISTSGNFPVLALFMEAPRKLVFSYFISDEGAFWQQWNDVFQLEQEMFDAVGGSPLVTLILAHSSEYSGTNALFVQELYQQILSRHYSGMQLLETSFPYSHVETDDPSFEDAIVRILG